MAEATDTPKSHLTPANRVMAIRLANACAPFHLLSPNTRLQVVRMFLLVGMDDGSTIGELAKRCGVSKNDASRYLRDLGTTDRYGRPGLGLVTIVQRVYGDRREHRVHVTARGAEIIDTVQVALTELRPVLLTPA
jgi:DNA-binding MarR family transcriptional regulator